MKSMPKKGKMLKENMQQKMSSSRAQKISYLNLPLANHESEPLTPLKTQPLRKPHAVLVEFAKCKRIVHRLMRIQVKMMSSSTCSSISSRQMQMVLMI